ncbi:YjbQ family protein [Candidatus Woesearchaeota archaeon]|nr:YjbQ family protein [Candidatus Woesearchaeota archaeon]
MNNYLNTIILETDKHTRFYDITDNVTDAVRDSGIKEGHIVIQPAHTTTGVFVNENEEYLLDDLMLHLDKKAPQRKGGYLHDNIAERDCPDDEPENAHSHIKAALYSNSSLSLILSGSRLQLGKYQRVFFAEFDGPCPRKHKNKRRCLVSILGE